MRKLILISWLTFLSGGICVLFWYTDWQYQLPTPVPEGYHAIAAGTRIDLKPGLERKDGKPLFLHFFNPACPCSRFNFKHFKWLADTYSNEVDFAIVIMSNKKYTAQELQDKFDTHIPVIDDTAIARICGVYSTPQAVIINSDAQLYYRGNYNSTRYCTDKKTEYARIALDALLNDKNIPFDQAALKAYGCTLPQCKR